MKKLTIEMDEDIFKQLKAEASIKTSMGLLNPKINLMDKLAIMCVLGINKGLNSIIIKGD